MGVQTVELLGHDQRGHAQLGQSRPHFAPRRGVTPGPGTNCARYISCGQCRVDTGREIMLLFIEYESHGFLTPALSLGKPSKRSAMILR